MLTLPADIQFMVLDYVGFVYMHPEVIRRAGANLRHIKELIIEDEPLPVEPVSTHVGSLAASAVLEFDAANDTPGQRNYVLCRILQMFKLCVLRRFCFVSRRPLSQEALDILSETQDQLEVLQTTAHPQLHQFLGQVRSLDVHVVEDEIDAGYYLKLITESGNHIRRFHLSADMGAGYGSGLQTGAQWNRRMPNLRELWLSQMGVKNLFDPLSTAIDFAALTYLSLIQAAGADTFVSALGEASQTTGLSLEHLAVEFLFMGRQRGAGPFDQCLRYMFEACKAIKSLHVGWNPKLSSPETTLKTIQKSGHHLELLSLTNNAEAEALTSTELGIVCANCPNLKQFGYAIHDGMIIDTLELTQFLSTVSRLKNLRLLHTRFRSRRWLGITEREPDYCNPELVAPEMQRFANKIFGELRRLSCCPMLDALVVGSWQERDSEDEMNLDNDDDRIDQFCFVRAVQRDDLNRTEAVGVPVSRAILRQTQLYTDILDLDPNAGYWGQ
ncbi:hypothetical protein CC86DRAFT_415251 [Ophiobolus disseminans]|uniref:Uncharacterized protein n=1 Tax=Ophiobolus disseminans TaxID=1469910 RepID=A0A6A7AKG4_9PLEO|nr:hypothetical protein CC86DRAFT_415251 [Ophiobolus disseminans]